MSKELDFVVKTDYMAHLQMCHGIMFNHLLGNDWYLEYCASIAQEFAAGDRTRVIVNMPPGYGKTTIFTICLITWLLAHDPSLRIMLVSHDAELAKDILFSIRKIIKSKKFREIYPIRVDAKRDSAEDLGIEGGGRVYACSIHGGITGRRFDLIVVDDPLAIKHANKLSRIQEINRIFDKEIISRLSDPINGRVIVSMHRLHEQDLTAHLMKNGGYDRIALSLIAVRTKTYTSGGRNWERPKGEQLRRDLYSKERIRELREEEGFPTFHLLYQQGLGKNQEFRITPEHFPLLEPRTPSQTLPVVFSIDTVQAGEAATSWNVILVLVRLGDVDIVLDEFHARCDYRALYEAFHELARHYNPSAVVIEDMSFGSALISQLQRESVYTIHAVKPKGPKARRLRRHLRRIREGRICLLQGAPWFGDFVGEFGDFPFGATDRIDALTQYLDFRRTRPKLVPPARLEPRQRTLPAIVHSRPLSSIRSAPPAEAPGASLRLHSLGRHHSFEQQPRSGMRPEPNRDPITVVFGTPGGGIRKRV